MHVREGGKWVFRPPKPDDPPPEELERRPRSNIKTPKPDEQGNPRADGLAHNALTVPELIVFYAQRILMGSYTRQLLSMFWSGDPGDRVPAVACLMRENRHLAGSSVCFRASLLHVIRASNYNFKVQ